MLAPDGRDDLFWGSRPDEGMRPHVVVLSGAIAGGLAIDTGV